jgi:hypothetical protein
LGPLTVFTLELRVVLTDIPFSVLSFFVSFKCERDSTNSFAHGVCVTGAACAWDQLIEPCGVIFVTFRACGRHVYALNNLLERTKEGRIDGKEWRRTETGVGRVRKGDIEVS